MNQRIIPWGTVLAGTIALGTAVLVGLTEVAGVSIPVRSGGPGAVIVIGVLILVAGLVVVLRAGRADRARAGTYTADTTAEAAITEDSVAGPPPVPVPSSPGPLEVSDAATGPDGETAQSSH